MRRLRERKGKRCERAWIRRKGGRGDIEGRFVRIEPSENQCWPKARDARIAFRFAYINKTF